MSEHEAKEPGLPVSRPPRFSNGVLLFCVLVLAAIVLYQNWPGRAPAAGTRACNNVPQARGLRFHQP